MSLFPTPALAITASNIRLADPLWLLAIAVLPLAVWLRGRARVPVLLVPFAAAWHRTSIAASHWTAGFALAGLVLVIGAMARPQRVEDKREVRSQGYDIMLAVDLSGSMLSEDYEKDGERINRLQAIKPVIQAFIDRRTSDRIGVVLFSSKAYTLSPLTMDHAWLARQIERVKIGLIRDGTAIGDALGVALARRDQSARETNGKRKGAFIVLLTDGATQSPEPAAYLTANPTDVRYAIGGTLAAAGADPGATAVFGQDLYDTSAAVAEMFFPSPSAVGAATGAAFPDALSAGPGLGRAKAPLLLVAPTGPLPPAIRAYLNTVGAGVTSGTLFGGSLAVSDQVLAELDGAV